MRRNMLLLALLLMACNMMAQQDFGLEADNVAIKQGMTGELLVDFVDETEDFAGFQFDVNLPEGVTVEKAVFYEYRDYLEEGGSAHTVTIHQEGTKCKLMCSAPNNIYMDLDNERDLLITLTLRADADMTPGDYDGYIDNIKFAKLFVPELGDRYITFDDVPFSLTIEENRIVVLDENAAEAPEGQSGVNVELRRTMVADKWNTFVMPFRLTNAQVKALFGDETKVATFQSATTAEDGTVVLNFANYTRVLAANTPYLVKPQNGGNVYVIEGVDVAPAEAVVKRGDISFIGTYTAGEKIPVGDYYLSDETFYRSAGLTSMKGFRGYFHDDSTAESRQLRLTFDDVTTGIEQLEQTPAHAEACYDLKGMKRGFAGAGIYVIRNNNGTIKKVIK